MKVDPAQETAKVSYSESAIPLSNKLRELVEIFMIDVRDHYFGDGSAARAFAELDECARLIDAYGNGIGLQNSRALEIGYGPRATRLIAMMGLGIDVIGIDVDAPVLAGKISEFVNIYRTNGLERAIKSAVSYFCFGLLDRLRLVREISKRGGHLRIDESRILVGDAGPAVFPDGTFDLILSHEVFEHISVDSLQMLIPKMARWLKPDGLAMIRPNIYTGICGGHLAEWFSADQKSIFKRRSEPWEHLRKNRFQPNTYLNRLPRADYRRLFSRHFEILAENVLNQDAARVHLTPEIARELKEYSEDELLGGQVLFVMRPLPVRSQADAAAQDLVLPEPPQCDRIKQ